MVGPSGIDCGAACANFRPERLGKLIKEVEILLASYTVATGHDNRGTLEVDLRLLHMAVYDLHAEILRIHIFVHVEVDHFSFIIAVAHLTLHDPFAHRGHLRTAFRVDDRGHNVASESRTYLIEKVLVFLPCLRVGVVADFKARAVCRQAAVQAGADTRAEVAAD